MHTHEHITDRGFEELASRKSNGIAVRLLWDRTTDATVVNVVDGTTGTAFVLAVGDASPMDVFHHPFAYAAFRDVLAETEQLAAVGA